MSSTDTRQHLHMATDTGSKRAHTHADGERYHVHSTPETKETGYCRVYGESKDLMRFAPFVYDSHGLVAEDTRPLLVIPDAIRVTVSGDVAEAYCDTTAQRDALLLAFPDRKASDTPGVYRVAGGTLTVRPQGTRGAAVLAIGTEPARTLLATARELGAEVTL